MTRRWLPCRTRLFAILSLVRLFAIPSLVRLFTILSFALTPIGLPASGVDGGVAGVGQDPAGAAQNASNFSISGTVVNGRDGSPVPFALLHAEPSAAGVQLSPRPLSSADSRARSFSGRGAGGQDARVGGHGGGRTGRAGRAARASANPADEASATADGSGRFRMMLPHGGRWTLSASAHGFGTQNFDTHDGYFASVVLNDADQAYSLIFRLTPQASFSGTVLDEMGEPVEDAQVTAELLPKGSGGTSEDAQLRIFGSAATDDRGHYELTALEPGPYRIKVVATPWYSQNAGAGGFGRQTGTLRLPQQNLAQTSSLDPSLDLVYAPSWFPGTSDQSAAQVVTLHAGEERQADIQLLATPAVHLEIPLEPAAGDREARRQNNVVITRVASTGFDFATPVIAAGGSTGRSGGLTPGLYQIRRGGQEGAAASDEEVREIEIPPGASGTVTLDGAHPLVKVTIAFDGPAGGNEDPGQVTFVDTVTGRRIAASETGFRHADRGSAERNVGEQRPQAQVERVAYLPSGRYAVYVEFSGQAYMTGLSATGATTEGRLVTIVDGKPKLTLHLASGRAELGGMVQTAAPAAAQAQPAANASPVTLPVTVPVALPVTSPVEGAMVVLVPITLGQPGTLDSSYRDESNTDGSFDLTGVVPGRYILIALDHGWDVDFHDPAALAKYLTQGIPVEIAAGVHLERRIVAQTP